MDTRQKTKRSKLKFYRDKARRARWRITSGNNEILGASSQSFAAKYSARKNLRLLRDALNELLK